METLDSNQKKAHRKPQSGRKAGKKKKNPIDLTLDPKIRNPKAFTFNSVVRAERKFRRTRDIETRKERVPEVDRTPIEPPPYIVAIVGPPKVGKSLLFSNLVKTFTRQNLNNVKGPVTVVSGKKRRITLIECNNDIHSMIDVAKIADLVLLLIDASFGFEMEIFEFLNICQVHGFPQIMGVLTHLDLLKNKKQLKNIKKTLKHRFWTEVYPGAKLFYLSGFFSNTNSYPKNELQNLSRFISVMKFRPTLWRSQHSYLLADRMEELTPPDLIRNDPKTDRTICLYGYVHGTFLKPSVSVHIPGLGDYIPSQITSLIDPCPLPMKERVLRRSLNDKEKLIYAPFSGVGGIVYDKDAVYIELGGSHSHSKGKDETEEESNVDPMVGELRGLKTTINEKMKSVDLKLFSDSVGINADDLEESNVFEDDGEENSSDSENDEIDNEEDGTEGDKSKSVEIVNCEDGRVRRKVLFNKNSKDKEGEDNEDFSEEDDDDEGEDEDDENQFEDEEDENEELEEDNDGKINIDSIFEKKIEKTKEVRHKEASEAFYSRFKNRSIQKLIYDGNSDYLNINSRADFDLANCDLEIRENLLEDEEEDTIKDLFVGGDFAESAQNILDDNDSDAFGDFEELDRDDDDDFNNDEGETKREKMPTDEKGREELKKKLKEKFDMDYDDKGGKEGFLEEWKVQVEKQSKLNRTFFDEIDDPKLLEELRGFSPGMYIRIEINRVPYEFVKNFDPQKNCPLIVGSLDTANQETLGNIQARVKKHRWHPKILKSNDPILLSIGWRRFQSIAIYSVQDHNMRNRMIKYTPQHLHCIANFYGPMTPQGTGILGIAPTGFSGFRITLTGNILNMDKGGDLVKKLKLIGTPMKIFKKSAFINGMFSSQLEIAKFVGARIKSVSGIRGVIKRPLKSPPGVFRATFEDKILMSDIVFCRTWVEVDVPKFFISLPTQIVENPRLLKTLGQLKRENNIKAEANSDNLYQTIERTEKQFRPLKIPKRLQNKLPYKDKPKLKAKTIEHKRIAVIKEPHERKMSQFLKTMKNKMREKEEREKEDKAKKAVVRGRVLKKFEERQTKRQKELRKKVFRTLGQMEKSPKTNGKGQFNKKRK